MDTLALVVNYFSYQCFLLSSVYFIAYEYKVRKKYTGKIIRITIPLLTHYSVCLSKCISPVRSPNFAMLRPRLSRTALEVEAALDTMPEFPDSPDLPRKPCWGLRKPTCSACAWSVTKQRICSALRHYCIHHHIFVCWSQSSSVRNCKWREAKQYSSFVSEVCCCCYIHK